MAVSGVSGKHALIGIKVDDAFFDEFIRELGLTPGHVKKAQEWALRQLGKWLIRVVAQKGKDELGIAQKHFRRRFKIYFDKNFKGLMLKAWFGTNPISYDSLGSPKQTAKGVKVGRKTIRGAFYSDVRRKQEQSIVRKALRLGPKKREPKPGIFIRKSSPYYQGKDAGQFTGRLPIAKPRIEIDETVRKALSEIEAKAQSQLLIYLKKGLDAQVRKVQGIW